MQKKFQNKQGDSEPAVLGWVCRNFAGRGYVFDDFCSISKTKKDPELEHSYPEFLQMLHDLHPKGWCLVMSK